MRLSKSHLPHINTAHVDTPPLELFQLPEKVLQFGTGVLLRGLPDYFIDNANRAGIFNGRIVVVKSTGSDTDAFAEQDGLYTLCIRGVDAGNLVEANQICASVSRVLSANEAWGEVLRCAQNKDINTVISNTTEVGIQLVQESIFQQPPRSFPAKLLAFLYERFKKLGNDAAALVVLPTELISDNGKRLQAIVLELAHLNNLEAGFFAWLNDTVHFCNTLVDCIVPGKPEPAKHRQLQDDFGYEDALLVLSEAYRLWAIEGDATIASLLTFAQADSRIIITPDITKYKELKLRLLNGTHTLSCGLAHLAGIGTVREAMANATFASFITHLMLEEIAPAIPCTLSENEATHFGQQVLDRFRNPHIQHRWLSISVQYTSKMAMRVVPVLVRYMELHTKVPARMALSVAAFLLFMRPVKREGNKLWGERAGGFYPIQDEQAAYLFELWQTHKAEALVHTVLQNKTVWGTDLSSLTGFESAVQRNVQQLLHADAETVLTLLQSTM